MKYLQGGSYLVRKITPRFTGGIPPLAIGYKYNSIKVVGFISTEGVGITEPGDPFLSRFPDIYSNVSVRPVVLPHLLGRYFNACNTICNNNSMHQYDIALEKYLVTQSGYFRLATTVALGMSVTYGRLLYCHGVSKENFEQENFNIGVQQQESLLMPQ